MSCLVFFVLFLRDVSLFASSRIVVPFLRDEQLGVDENVHLSRNVSEKGADLSVVDLAEASEVLPCDPGGTLAFFFKSARIEGEDRVLFADELDGFLGDAVEDCLVVPNGFADAVFQKYGCKARRFCPNR